MDLGLLGGAAEGLKQGVQSYQTERQYQQDKMNQALDRRMKQQQQQSALIDKNQEIGPDESVHLNDLGQKKKSFESTKVDSDTAELDPNSDKSKSQGSFAQSIIDASNPSGKIKLPDGMSAHDLKSENGLVGKAITGGYGAQGRAATLAAQNGKFEQNLAYKNKRLENQQEVQANALTDRVYQDHIVAGATQQKQAIDRGQHTLNTVKILTPEIFNEIQGDIAAAISKGSSGAASEQQKKEFTSYNNEFAKFKERLLNRPEDIGSPETRAYLNDVMSRLSESYQSNIDDRSRQLLGNKSYSTNQKAADMVNKMQAQLPSQKPGLMKEPNPQPTPDSQAMEWAKANPQDPRSAKILQVNGVK